MNAGPLTFRSAATLDLASLTEAFNQAFANYLVPMHHTPDSFAAMMRVTDVRVEHSIVAYTADGKVAGVAMLAVRGTRGWVGGFGVTTEQRGHHRAPPLLDALLARARAAGVQRLLLEVLKDNIPAQGLYLRGGFQVTRPFEIFLGRPIATPSAATPGCQGDIHELPPTDALREFDALHPVAPAWQRERASLAQSTTAASALAMVAPDGSGLDAYLIYTATSDGYVLHDLGIRGRAVERSLGAGIALVAALDARQPGAIYRTGNAPTGDPLGEVMRAVGCPIMTSQYEMALALA